MPSQGYVRFPTIHQDRIVFVSEDDLWLVSSEGGRAERLTAGVNPASHPHFSPDGQYLAFVGREEGPSEVYIMPALGGPAQRLTFDAELCTVVGWSPSGDRILYASDKEQFDSRYTLIYAVGLQGGPSEVLPFGRANAVSYNAQGGVVIGRNIEEPAYWKRYRGGRTGHLWCDRAGNGCFKRLLNLHGNIANPCWVGERIYFLSDHEGVGNIYSCTPDGEDVRRHSNQRDFYARHLNTDGDCLVFSAAADLYLFDPKTDCVKRLDIIVPSQRTKLNRQFVSADHYLDTFELHPEGHALAITTRGKAFSMSNWEGAVLQHGERDGVRYRFLNWLNDGQRLVAACDASGKDTLVIFDPESDKEPELVTEVEFGRCTSMSVSPVGDVIALTNHRHEVIVVDLEQKGYETLDRSDYAPIGGLAWSADGRWLAYSFAISKERYAIKIGDMATGETHIVTNPLLRDWSPSFDPQGRYLYFLGSSRGITPYAIMLRSDLRSPFIVESKLEHEAAQKRNAAATQESDKEESSEEEKNGEQTASSEDEEKQEKDEEDTEAEQAITIDFVGITERIQPFPVKNGRYWAIRGIKGKVLLFSTSLEALMHANSERDAHLPRGIIEGYDLETQKLEKLIDGMDKAKLSRNNKMLVYSSHHNLRVVKAGEKPPRGESERPGRETGWIDLDRVKVSIQPLAEWKQMFAEAWRLQREHFWTEDMSGVDWNGIYVQYAPLVERVGSRSELSDLIKELQGELSTSHTYERGAEYRNGRNYRQGFLGVNWRYDTETQRYRIGHIIRGDTSEENTSSPLTLPGLEVREGDAVLAINGQRIGVSQSPQEALVNLAEQEVRLTIESAESKEIRMVTVPTMASEAAARYREWVEHNRTLVHKLSADRVGYIHIPDMQFRGSIEFDRSYMIEYDYPALIIDVRWNSGGNISEQLLEKLARKRIGYSFSRWGKPEPYPKESPRGPMVALANEHTSSDGDIFSHAFKLMKLGPLIGMRTWGGVIGYYTHPHRLVDLTRTTQPEFATWFMDVGWNLENYGTEPDIEVDMMPEDYINAADPQLERAVIEALRIAETYPVLEPNPGEKPRTGR